LGIERHFEQQQAAIACIVSGTTSVDLSSWKSLLVTDINSSLIDKPRTPYHSPRFRGIETSSSARWTSPMGGRVPR